MAEFHAPATLSAPGYTIDFNVDDVNGNRYFITSIDGLDGEPLRTPGDDASQEDGGRLYDFYSATRHITVTGLLVIGPSYTAWQSIVQRNTMERNLRLACKALKRATGTWSWEPAGFGPYALTVKCDLQPSYPGEGVLKQFVFGLAAPDPDYD